MLLAVGEATEPVSVTESMERAPEQAGPEELEHLGEVVGDALTTTEGGGARLRPPKLVPLGEKRSLSYQCRMMLLRRKRGTQTNPFGPPLKGPGCVPTVSV